MVICGKGHSSQGEDVTIVVVEVEMVEVVNGGECTYGKGIVYH